MKSILITVLSFLSVNTYANNLHCVSSGRTTNNNVTIQGQVNQGETLSVNILNQGNLSKLEVVVNKIKPFSEFVEIHGIARNMVFIGGGSINLQLILPLTNIKPALLRTMTPSFNQAPRLQEIEMSCVVKDLYQVLPIQPDTLQF